jgi:hypothetical protein
MSSMKTATVEPDGGVRLTAGPGSRSDTNLKAIFATSPLYNEYNAATVQNAGLSVLNGAGGPGDNIPNIGINAGSINESTSYYGFPSAVNLNFLGAPDIENEVVTGGEGLPASPYVPNLASAPNASDPLSQPAYTGVLPQRGNQYGSGLGTAVTPAETSTGIASQKLGTYISGKSYLGSVGAYNPS